MVKKSHESETRGSKRKKPASIESEVCTDQNMEIKVKKKRKKTELEEAPVPASIESEVCTDQNMEIKVKKKRKKTEREEAPVPASIESEVCTDQNMEIKVKKKRKKTELEEPPVPALTETKKTKKHKQQPEEPQKEKKKKKTKKSLEEPTISPEEEGENVIEGEEDLSPEERRVLDRKMKKILKKEEKEKLKAEGKTEDKAEADKPVASQHALDYLTCWAERRQEWKFQKTRQTWLLQHMFDSDQVPDESFSVLLSYLEGSVGLARTMTIQKAETLVREKVAVTEGEEGNEEEKDTQAQKKAERARELIQLLS